MEKRAVLAIILSLIVLFGANILFKPEKKPQKIESGEEKQVESTERNQPGEKHAVAPPVDSPEDFKKSKLVVLENSKVILTFDSWGARLLQVTLKEYSDLKGNPIDLLSVEKDSPYYPLGLLSDNKKLDILNVNYQTKVNDSSEIKEVIFTTKVDKLEISKKISLEPDSYLVKLENTWRSLSNEQVNIPSYSLIWEPQVYINKKDDKTDELRVVANVNNKIRDKKLRKIKDALFNLEYESETDESTAENVNWIALSSRYFIGALISKNNRCTSKTEIIKSDRNIPQSRLLLKVTDEPILQNNSVSNKFEIYVGPKEISYLASLGSQMEENIDFGFFGAFSKFLLYALRYINKYVSNFGVSIIILSVLIKAITYPLAHKSFVSMKKMQKVTPLVNEIRDKYKDNQQKVNQEIMALYKRHKVNPLGGCLPMEIGRASCRERV